MKTKLTNLLPSLIPLIVALFGAVLLLLLGSPDPQEALSAFFGGPFRNLYYFGNMLDAASYLIITALGVSIAFSSGGFNLGGEGQVYAGAFTAGLLWLVLSPALQGLGIVVGLFAAALAGGVMALISALIRKLLGISELISSYLLSLSLIPLLDGLLSGPLRDTSRNLLSAARINPAFTLPRLLLPSTLNLSLIFALILAVGIWLFLYGSKQGYELRAAGANAITSKFAGIPTGVYALAGFTLSGILHGLAGGLAVSGTYHAAMSGMTSGMGWNGIAAALIGRNHPLGVVLGALFFAYLQTASKAAMIVSDFSTELSIIVQALVFLLITLDITLGRKRQVLHD